jgi:tol-pal system protein YbgF
VSRRAALPLAPLALLTGALALAGCAGAGSAPRSAVDPDEIAELKARVIELQRKAAVDEVEIARLREQVTELAGGRAGATPPAARRGARAPAPSAPLPPRDLDAGDPALRPAAPAIEEADLDVAPPPSRPGRKAAPAPPPPARSRVTPARPGPEPSAPAASPEPGTEPGETGRPVSAAAQALYDRGYSLYNQGHFVDAEASFQRFLQTEPASDLSDNALYWIGECRYSRGDLKGALAAFRETVQRFPAANKVPDAMLKEGQTLEAMHDVEGARVTYREVVRRFPGTAAAALADERRSKLP